MDNRIKKNKCSDHADNRDMSEYVFWHTDIRKEKHVDIYECRICRERLDRSLDRQERMRDHNKKQNAIADDIATARYRKKRLKRLKSIEFDLWDFTVRKELSKGMKLKGRAKIEFEDSIPKEVLQLARATMKLNYAIQRIKKNLPSLKQIEEAEKLKQAEESRAAQKPLMRCAKHGDLFWSAAIKSGKEPSGRQRYKCKECMKAIHADNYKRNKEKITQAHALYKEQDPAKYRDMKNSSKRKCWALNKEKYIKKGLEFDKKHPDKKSARQKRYKDKAVKELTDGYVKQHIVAGTNLKFSDVPQSLVETKKEVMKLKRVIKKIETKKEKRKLKKIIRSNISGENNQYENVER